MKRRSFKITFCLGSGYSGDGKIHSFEEAEQAIENWMLNRIQQNKPTISGFLQFGKLIFPAKGRRNDGKFVTVTPSAIYEGELSSENDINRERSEIKDTLETLALELKGILNQDRVYIIFEDENWFV